MRPETDSKNKLDDSRAELPRGDTADDTSRRRTAQAGSPGGAMMSWQDIKARFVDDPKGAVDAAEQLVRNAVEEKIRALEDEAAAVCMRGRDEDASSTDELRARLLRCLDFCEHLAGTMPH